MYLSGSSHGSGEALRDVVAFFANRLRDHPEAHESREDCAAQAEANESFEAGRDREAGNQNNGDCLRTTEPRNRRTGREHQTDTLRKTLGLTGDQTAFAFHCRRQYPSRQLSERTQFRTGQHPSRETVGQGQQHPTLTHDQEENRLQYDTGRHPAGRPFVDRIRKTKETTVHAVRLEANSRLNKSYLKRPALPPYSASLGSVLPVALVLTADSAAWNRHVDSLAISVDGLVPVVKGNGYGFGREWLAERAALLAPTIAVGTIFEVPSLPPNCTALVLTPTLHVSPELRDSTILTVGSVAHVEAAATARQRRSVVVKVRSSMNRYGATIGEVPALIRLCQQHDLDVRGVSIHPPLVGSSLDHAREISQLLDDIDPVWPAWVSHVDPQDFRDLQTAQPERQWLLRLGTSLWHGDKSSLALTAEVIDAVAVEAGQRIGYRGVETSGSGTVVMIGCGSAHGIAPLADGSSPFHFSRQRLPLVESPHMHTSMCFVPAGQPSPVVGQSVEVQRPLITTLVDRIDWT